MPKKWMEKQIFQMQPHTKPYKKKNLKKDLTRSCYVGRAKEGPEVGPFVWLQVQPCFLRIYPEAPPTGQDVVSVHHVDDYGLCSSEASPPSSVCSLAEDNKSGQEKRNLNDDPPPPLLPKRDKNISAES